MNAASLHPLMTGPGGDEVISLAGRQMLTISLDENGIPVAGDTVDDRQHTAHANSSNTSGLNAAALLQIELVNARWVVTSAGGSATINGVLITVNARLFDRDVVALNAQHRWEFVSGERRTTEMEHLPEDAVRMARRRRAEFERPPVRRPWASVVIVTVALILGVVAVGVLRYGPQKAERAAAVMSDAQAGQFDSLLVVAFDHIERGNSLLELGLSVEAANEFARGINTLALSSLRNHPLVKPRISALESSIASIYRARTLAVPDAYARATPGDALSAEKLRSATLSVEQFAHAFELVSSAYRLRFRQTILVVGRDHPEHLALYGPGGALDLRSMFMSPEQISFVIAQCRSYGIRVKDFSQDSILRLQVRAAVRAGLAERAGTGLHLHVDRFADRRDRWTIGAVADPQQKPSTTLLGQLQ